MDKYEYQVCADQIKSLLSERKYTEAMDVADSIDWRRVKSVSMLCTVSEIYKINKRYEESRDILLLAYERYPNGRMIVYALCELAVKMEDILQAVEYYKEFVQIAPGDTGSYILLYKIYEVQDVSLEERIEVLKEFKKRDYREKWAYELAYLYHKTGQETNCIAECDELILWFGEGRYVKKAMELKMEHTGLSTDQKIKYEGQQENASLIQMPEAMSQEQNYGSEHIQIQPVNTGKFSTMNLQEELAKSMEEFLINEDANTQTPYYGQGENLYESAQAGQDYQQMYEQQPQPEYSQQEYEQAVYEPQMYVQPGYEPQAYGQAAEEPQELYEPPVTEESQPVYEPQIYSQQVYEQQTQEQQEYDRQGYDQSAQAQQMYGLPVEEPQELYESPVTEVSHPVNEAQTGTSKPEKEVPRTAGKKYDSMLSQEYDGQISLSLPDTDMVEKQITGQINLEDVLKGWEEKKRENEQKRLTEVKRRSLEQTNDIMSQLIGVIPGIQLPKEPEKPVREPSLESDTPAPRPVLIDDSVFGMDDGGDEQEEEKASAGLPMPSVVKVPITKSKVTMAIPGTLPSGRIMTLEEEYGGNLARIREQDEKLVKRQTGEIPRVIDAPEELLKTPSAGETQIQEESIKTAPIAEAQEEPVFVQEPPLQQAADNNEGREEYPEEPILPQSSVMPEYPYEAEDYGEVEELEDIEQPEELDDIIKTRDLPLDAIAQANYEAGIEPEDAEEDPEDIEESLKENKKKKSNHPSYMTLEEAPKSRREFDEEEQRIFARFEGIEVLKAQIVDVMDDMSMNADKGNVIVTGSDLSGRKGLAIDIVKAIQIMDSNFSGKVAKISGEALNKKNIQMTIKKLQNGALIVENAGGLTKDSMKLIAEALSEETEPVLVVLEGTKDTVQPLLNASKLMKGVFNARIDIAEYTNDDLVAYGRGYAKEQEYSIDEMGVLALYTRIGELQALDHIVSVDEVKEIIDTAIKHVDKKNMSHFMDVLFAKRYDEEDYIILREKDFITK
ncbi:MAG: hypothetical protein QM697_02000 [Lachnospiraceae bacterium]